MSRCFTSTTTIISVNRYNVNSIGIFIFNYAPSRYTKSQYFQRYSSTGSVRRWRYRLYIVQSKNLRNQAKFQRFFLCFITLDWHYSKLLSTILLFINHAYFLIAKIDSNVSFFHVIPFLCIMQSKFSHALLCFHPFSLPEFRLSFPL